MPEPMFLPDSIDVIRRSVVQIRLRAMDLCQPQRQQLGGSPVHETALGTGFLVGDEGHVVTAWHVVAASQEFHARQHQLLVGLAEPNTERLRSNFHIVGATLVAGDERHDLALLKLDQNPITGDLKSMFAVGGELKPLHFESAKLRDQRPRDGESVAVSGFPLDNTTLVTTSGGVASSWALDVREVDVPGAPPGFKMPEIADSYLADASVNGGNSGGPVFLIGDASVIGVCVAFQPAQVRGLPLQLFYSSGLSIVVPSKYVLELLAGNGVKVPVA